MKSHKERIAEIEREIEKGYMIYPIEITWLITRVRVLTAALEQRPNMNAETFESIPTGFKHEFDTWETIVREALAEETE